MKVLATAALLALAPLSALAACWEGHDTAMNCADGYTYDADQGTCVESVTG